MPPGEPSHPGRIQKAASFLLWLLKDQWFVLGLALVIVVASQVQVPASQQEVKATIISYLSPAVIFFVTGCTLSTRSLINNYARWKVNLFVQCHCFLVTSSLGFAVVYAVATNKQFMDPWLLIGLIISASLPTTIASNVVMTRQAKGNTALTVVQTTIGNSLGVFFCPLLVKMYVSASAWYTVVLPQHSSGVGALYRRTFMQLGLTIYVPMIIGQIIRNLFEERTTKFFNKWKLNKVAQLALLMLVWQTFDRAFETRAFETIPSSNMIFIVFISIVNWLVWLIVCFVTSVFWLPREDVISVCFCVPGKTLAVGIPLSTVLWTNTTLVDQGKLQIPMVVFQAFQVFLSSLLTIPLRKWAVTGKINQDQEEQVRSESSSADAQKEVTAGSHSKEGVGGKTEQELLPSAETV